ncbi:hypothetical protein P775_18260 [Puniceibacterium antarcticum]|uniref:Uncharacterized protein n=1 Tax=Puniceibacterium antarcticum TaxID=1206336 RepID=A0A2G8RBM8_9RHOB|nr:hypothetical protein [Puniceibacterium antarcticum]PIL18518.1 hypothetical protein P775_18260 [Puniceibacterium antarcticum]
MKKLTAAALVVTLATPLHAQEAEGEGFDLMKEGARQLFRGLMQQMGPVLGDMQDLTGEMGPKMRDFVQQMGPALSDLMGEVDDWSVYHPPEMLPNGDIIMRHKTPEELAPEPEAEEIEI